MLTAEKPSYAHRVKQYITKNVGKRMRTFAPFMDAARETVISSGVHGVTKFTHMENIQFV